MMAEAGGQEEEDDYMSASFVAEQVVERASGGGTSKKRRRVNADVKLLSKKEIAVKADVVREEGLTKKLCPSNKGFKLLEKLGWKGKGLGKEQTGMVDPLMPQLKEGRAGLGRDIELRVAREKSKIVHKEQTRLASRADDLRREEFRGLMSANFSAKQVAYDLRKARKAVQHLDEVGGQERTPLWPGGDNDDDDDPGHKRDAAMQELVDEWNTLLPEEQLACCVEYLRSIYCYCCFCGVKYETTDDLSNSCPGARSEDHDE
jgi:hypothetical protein